MARRVTERTNLWHLIGARREAKDEDAIKTSSSHTPKPKCGSDLGRCSSRSLVAKSRQAEERLHPTAAADERADRQTGKGGKCTRWCNKSRARPREMCRVGGASVGRRMPWTADRSARLFLQWLSSSLEVCSCSLSPRDRRRIKQSASVPRICEMEIGNTIQLLIPHPFPVLRW